MPGLALRVWAGPVLEAQAFVAGLDDFAMIGEPVEERGGHLGVAEDQVRCDDDRLTLIELTDEIEKELAT